MKESIACSCAAWLVAMKNGAKARAFDAMLRLPCQQPVACRPVGNAYRRYPHSAYTPIAPTDVIPISPTDVIPISPSDVIPISSILCILIAPLTPKSPFKCNILVNNW